MQQPTLYSFRRCPYAMRARLGLASAGVSVQLREILLRDKAPELIAASPKATVPVLDLGDRVIDESLDIMGWALGENDPEGWLQMPDLGHDLIRQSDTDFKPSLDLYKYRDSLEHRQKGCDFLHVLDQMLTDQPYLFGASPRLADMAIITFVRQFAFVDKAWFDDQPWPGLACWLQNFISSDRFASIIKKYPIWQAGDPVTIFPAAIN